MRLQETLLLRKQFEQIFVKNMFLDILDIAKANELDTLLIEINRSGRFDITFDIDNTERIEAQNYFTPKAIELIEQFDKNYLHQHDFKDAMVQHFYSINKPYETYFTINLNHIEKSAKAFCGEEIYCLVEQELLSNQLTSNSVRKGVKI